MPNPLTPTEKAYFDTIKQVAKGVRPEDLTLMRMTLDGRDVAVIGQRVIDGRTAEDRGFMPLAMLLDTETIKRLIGPSGERGEVVDADEIEGAG